MTAGSAAAGRRGQRANTGLVVAGASGLLVIAFVLVAAMTALGGASLSAGERSPETQSDGVSALAEREIPPLYLRLYEQAAQRYGLDWAILAGIGKVECDHGRDPDPSCAQEGAVNSAGAGGPMQFLASTWAEYGVDADGAGPPNRWDPADAIYGAANYLRASGAPSDYQQAIFAYNHANWYVEEVESWAARYGDPASTSASSPEQASLTGDGAGQGAEASAGADLRLQEQSPTPVRFMAGERAELDPQDGHLAFVPAGVPAVVQAMVVAGNELQQLPYGPGGHPDPLGAREEDCSSTVNYVLYRAGVRPLAEILKDNPLAQDYVDWGAPGPGRWVTIYASASPTPHVFIVVAGLRLDTSHNGTDVGPNRFEDGPRWRILDHIPTWADWSVRHPPGL
ncbi:MAG: lytic transglycosylase domain-containing protein [Solirubrobacteraceae bacterium]